MTMRAYDNTLRREQADLTKRRILETVRDLLTKSRSSLSIPEIAACAGVSEPTIYRHFPNRDALLDAASEVVSQQLGAPPMPERADEIPVVLMAAARYFADNASWLRAALNEPALQGLRRSGRRRLVDRLRAVLEPRVAHLEPLERAVAVAAFGVVGRANSWDCLTREFELSSEEAGCALSWIAGALLDALAKSKRQKKARLVDEKTIERGRTWGTQPKGRKR
jgi:AcrR family transcriptional regulator